MKKLYTFLLATCLSLLSYAQYNPDYFHTVTVYENYGDNNNDYIAFLEVNTAAPIGLGRMDPNGDDIRFGDGCSSNYYDYWIEGGINTASTRIYVKIPFLAANDTLNFLMFYGDSSVSGMSDFNSTFPNSLITTGNVTQSGNKNYGWLEIAAGDTLFIGNTAILKITAAYAKIDGAIVGTGKGFTGGTVGPNAGNGPGGGGGSSNAGCGGGGYGGAGGLGGFDPNDSPGAGGSANGSSNGFTINKGSGGGSGSSCFGGKGGGAVMIKSRFIDIRGDIIMNGERGQTPGCGQGGGGGAGGGILIAGDSVSVTGDIYAVGGNGSIGTSTANDDGGGGGGGRIKVFYDANYNNAGSRIVRQGNGGPNGSTAASDGTIGTSFDTTRAFLNPVIGSAQFYPGPPPPTQASLEICNGDSVLLGGSYRKTDGMYTDTLTNNNGCDSAVVTTLTVIATDTSISQFGSILSAVTAGQNYQWLECDGNGYVLINGATNQTYQATKNGLYALAVNVNNCNDTSSCLDVQYVGIESWESKAEVYLYPNPGVNETNLHLNKIAEQVQVRITNVDGKEILNAIYKNSKKINFSTAQFSKGLYLIHLNIDGQFVRLKFIKE